MISHLNNQLLLYFENDQTNFVQISMNKTEEKEIVKLFSLQKLQK